MKHPTEDPLLFGIDVIDELVVEYMKPDTDNAEFSNFAEDIDVIGCLVQDLFDSKDDTDDLANLDHNSEFVNLIDNVCKYDEELECSEHAKVQVAETEKLLPVQVATILTTDQPRPRPANGISPLHSLPVELKPLLGHLKYAYLNNDQQFPVIIANNLHREQEEKLLQVLRQHKKTIWWRLLDLPRINPSICMHKILMEEEVRPIWKQ
ncbi:hypothetical protein CR513_41450, partial [Mucuna pruriens]